MNTTNPELSLEPAQVDNAAVKHNGGAQFTGIPFFSVTQAAPLMLAFAFAHAMAGKTVEVGQSVEFETSVVLEKPPLGTLQPYFDSKAVARARLTRLKEMQFSHEGRDARITRALQVLSETGLNFQFDPSTWKWIAQEADIEDF